MFAIFLSLDILLKTKYVKILQGHKQSSSWQYLSWGSWDSHFGIDLSRTWSPDIVDMILKNKMTNWYVEDMILKNKMTDWYVVDMMLKKNVIIIIYRLD